MPAIKSPTPLDEIIDNKRNDLIEKFPDERKQLVAFAEGAHKVVDSILNERSRQEEGLTEEDSKLNRICALFDLIDENYSSGLSDAVRKEIRSARAQARKEIESKKISAPGLNDAEPAKPTSITKPRLVKEAI